MDDLAVILASLPYPHDSTAEAMLQGDPVTADAAIDLATYIRNTLGPEALDVWFTKLQEIGATVPAYQANPDPSDVRWTWEWHGTGQQYKDQGDFLSILKLQAGDTFRTLGALSPIAYVALGLVAVVALAQLAGAFRKGG